MVRSSEKRKRKYIAKVDGDILKTQTEALKPLMVESESEYFSDMASIERRIKNLIEPSVASSIQVRDYLNYGRELYSLAKRFSSYTLSSEVGLKLNKWADRGLNSTLLERIAYLFGVTPSGVSPVSTEVDVIDRAGRLVGVVSLSSNEVDVTDRVLRLLGIVSVGNFPSGFNVNNFPASYNIRALVASDKVTVDNLLNPHPVSLSSIPNPSNLDVALSTRATGAILNPHPTTPAQTTRTSLKAQTEREDLVSLGGVVSPSAVGVVIVAASGQTKVKVFDAGYDALAAGLHYFYFGTSTVATARRFLLRQTGTGPILKTFVQPRIGGAGDGLYLYSAVAETNMPYDVGYVQE